MSVFWRIFEVLKKHIPISPKEISESLAPNMVSDPKKKTFKTVLRIELAFSTKNVYVL